jgi:hypothetical protein
VKLKILTEQNFRCRLCRLNVKDKPEDQCLDHDHVTGIVRSVLCRNCNGIEGKVFNLARRAKRDGTPQWWLTRLLEYWEHHKNNPSMLFHPVHRTGDEKRLLKNKRARLKRKRAKKEMDADNSGADRA